jgi:NAD-dependent DNA ligase
MSLSDVPATADRLATTSFFPRVPSITLKSSGIIHTRPTDAHEEGELLELLLHTVGGNAPARGEASMSTELPFTKPPPTIDFKERAFCFTGKFYAGTRSWCEEQVATRGAHCCAITRELNYLVIGDIGSRDWIHSTHGRKIEKALEYNERGCSIGIIGEQYWHAAL